MAMKKLTLREVAAVTGGVYHGDETDMERTVRDVVRDNRQVKTGSLFVCFEGERTDGHKFAAAAIEAGAACVLAQKALDKVAEPYILVPSTADALRELGKYYRGLFDIPVIGVIGSVGKTTAKEMTAAVLSQRYNVLKTPENLNNEIGVPLTLLSMGEEHEAAVIEMGISDFGEMSRLADMVRPDICLITNIGYCHLEKLGDLQGVMRAKSEVFSFMSADGAAVLCGDDALLRELEPGMKKITFGLSEGCDYRAVDIENRGLDGQHCRIESADMSIDAAIPAYGSHIILAALPAAAVGRILGLLPEEIAAGLASYQAIGGRANVIHTGFITLIDDCYNANPNSVLSSITALCKLTGNRTAILGDMKELGAASAELHRKVGEAAAERGVDRLICCGAEAEKLYEGFTATSARADAYWFASVAELLPELKKLIKKGDTVLVKASHSMGFPEITEALSGLRP